MMDPSRYLDLVNNCDENAPLLSATPLGQYLNNIPLDRVPPSYLAQLQQSLNVEQLIGTKDGLARDYRGLAELMGFSSIELESRFKRSYNPTKCLVDSFKTSPNPSASGSPPSVTDLLKLIEKLERFDLLDDLLPILISIVEESQQVLAERRTHALGVAPNQRINSLGDSNNHLERPQARLQGQAGRQQAFRDGRQQHKYDAFLCYAPEDDDYAQDIMRALENNNKRVVTVDNLLAGQFAFDALVQMIAVECRKVILILTPNFLESRDCEFQTKFANEIAIKSGWFPKIIPILCEPLDDAKLPALIRVISKIDMTRARQRDWQLRKLLGSLDYDEQGHDHTTTMGIESQTRLDFQRSHDGRQWSPPNAILNPHMAINGRLSPRLACLNGDGSSPTHQPIVDLAYSQSSSANISRNLSALSETTLSDQSSGLDSSGSVQTACNSGLSTPQVLMNLYRSFKKKVRGSSLSTSPSTSSRNILIPSSSTNTDSNIDTNLEFQQ